MSEHGPMEALYSKLFEKYKELKTKRIGGLENLQKDQEVKFATYIKAVEELVEHLRTQNNRLNLEAKDLRSELAYTRSSAEEQLTEEKRKSEVYEKLLIEEKRKNKKRKSGCVNPTDQATSVFQVLSEIVLGFKLSAEENCISAVHESSGYSFTLTLVKLAGGKEDAFQYHAVSLGTLEKVASDWMKDDIVFSAAMCPVFFERISYFVKKQA